MTAPFRIFRRSKRVATSLPPDGKGSWGRISKPALADISLTGCRIAGPDLALAPGDHILLRTTSLLGAAGTVRWIEGDEAGVEFDRALGQSVMEHFLRNAAAGVALIVPTTRILEMSPL